MHSKEFLKLNLENNLRRFPQLKKAPFLFPYCLLIEIRNICGGLCSTHRVGPTRWCCQGKFWVTKKSKFNHARLSFEPLQLNVEVSLETGLAVVDALEINLASFVARNSSDIFNRGFRQIFGRNIGHLIDNLFEIENEIKTNGSYRTFRGGSK